MLSKDDVKKIAELARIKLLETEEEKMQSDLSAILGYIETLGEVDTAMAGPQSHATDILNSVREDVVATNDLEKREKCATAIINNAPNNEKGFIKVKAVMQ